jgi:hypothetical protein
MPETCSFCQTSVPKCFLRCDNNCDRIYCSDSCAEADNGHHHINTETINYTTPNPPAHLSQTISQVVRALLSMITSKFHH